MRTLVALLFAATVLAGCAGTPFRFSDARQVRVGWTEAELTALLGRPYMVTARGNDQMWVWSQANFLGDARVVSFTLRDGRVAAVPTIPASFD